MPEVQRVRRGRRGRGRFRRFPRFASPLGRAGATKQRWRDRVIVGVFPALLFLAHLFFGANHVVAAQWLTVLLALGFALALVGSLTRSTAREDLLNIGPQWPLLLLFGLTLAAALWSLTPQSAGPAVSGTPAAIWRSANLPAYGTVNRSATLLEISKLLGLACAFGVGCVQAARASRARATFDVLLVLGTVYAAISLLTFLAGVNVLIAGRLSGGFLSANSGATVFGILTVLALANLAHRWRKIESASLATKLPVLAAPLAGLLLFVTCLLLTASRMGLAATALAAGALLLWEMAGARQRRLPVLIGGAVVVLTGLVLVFRGNDLVWSRLEAVDQDLMVRANIFQAHWNAFLSSPMFGYGLGTFNDVNNQIMTPENYKDLWLIRAAHNVYLQWVEEAGIVGATPMFLLIATILGVSLWRATVSPVSPALQRGLVVSGLVVLVHGATDYALQTPSIAAFWAFLLGLQFAFGQSRGKSGARRPA